jgi:hypothetical protein
MKKTFTSSMAELEIQPVRESHCHGFIPWENAPESFCSTLEPIWWRFPAEWHVHIVYVIHHDAGNSGKMANGKENRKRPDDCVKITQKGVWHPIKLPHE